MENVATDRQWWQGAIFYHIYPLSFRDSNGDGWGDLAGLNQHLEYVQSLGVDGIWLSPIHGTAMQDFGYDTTDHTRINPHLGTMEDFDDVLQSCHRLGLKVILDMVWAHTSNRHPWFQESRSSRTNDKSDWYLWADAKEDGCEPNNWRSLFGGPAWEWCSIRKQYYMTHFLGTMPHLRVQSEGVQSALLEIADFWIDRGVDGFRFDVANLYMVDDALRSNPNSGMRDFPLPVWAQKMVYDGSQPENLRFIERIRSRLDQQPDRELYSVAELSTDAPDRDSRDYCEGESRFHSAYLFPLFEKPDDLVSQFLDQIGQWGTAEAWPTFYFSNHDFVRGPSRILDDTDIDVRWKTLLALLFCIRGNIHLYQGDELGLPHAELTLDELRDPEGIRNYPHGGRRDGARTPMPWDAESPNAGFGSGVPWLPVDPRHRTRAVAQQERCPDSLLHFTRAIIRLRRSEAALRLGSQLAKPVGKTGLAIERQHGETVITALFNLSTEPLPLPETWSKDDCLFASDSVQIETGVLPAWGVLILRTQLFSTGSQD